MVIGLLLSDLPPCLQQQVRVLAQPGHEQALIRRLRPSGHQQMRVIRHQAIHRAGHLMPGAAMQQQPAKARVKNVIQPALAAWSTRQRPMHDGPAPVSPRTEPGQMITIFRRRFLITHATTMHRVAAGASPWSAPQTTALRRQPHAVAAPARAWNGRLLACARSLATALRRQPHAVARARQGVARASPRLRTLSGQSYLYHPELIENMKWLLSMRQRQWIVKAGGSRLLGQKMSQRCHRTRQIRYERADTSRSWPVLPLLASANRHLPEPALCVRARRSW